MSLQRLLSVGIDVSFVLLMMGLLVRMNSAYGQELGNSIELPEPDKSGRVSVEEALKKRRSVREFTDTSLSLTEVSQLLWAAQGITHSEDLRTAPSAGALYPLEICLAAGRVEGLLPGVYRYRPSGHRLAKIAEGDSGIALYRAALSQECVRDAAAVFVIAAVYERTTRKYGDRGIQYAHMEVGCAAENILLQATALNLGAVFVGAFDDDGVKKVVNLKEDECPLAILPVGRPR